MPDCFVTQIPSAEHGLVINNNNTQNGREHFPNHFERQPAVVVPVTETIKCLLFLRWHSS